MPVQPLPFITPDHVADADALPSCRPAGIDDLMESVRFDPSVHLQIEPPAYVKTLPTEANNKGQLVEFPVPISHVAEQSTKKPTARALSDGTPVTFTGLAYSAPFRLLSPRGVDAFREVILANEKHAHPLPSRSAKALRGLGYRSQFMRDFTDCEQVLSHFSAMAGTPLGPHHMGMNMGHANFGEIGNERPVDQWHIDSVPYVCVMLLSDATDMVGGQLQVALSYACACACALRCTHLHTCYMTCAVHRSRCSANRVRRSSGSSWGSWHPRISTASTTLAPATAS